MLENSTSQQFVEKNLAETTIIKIQNYEEGIDMVLNNKIDLMVADMTICILAVMRHPDSALATLNAPLNLEPIGMAISSEDAQFANLLTNYLTMFKGTGILDILHKKWLKDDAWLSSLP